MMKKVTQVVSYKPAYTLEDTSDKNIKRVCDIDGNWTHYFLVKENKYVKSITHTLSIGFNKGVAFRKYLENHSKEEIKKVLEEKGDEGSRTHKAITDLIMGITVDQGRLYPSEVGGGRQEPLSWDEWENLVAFANWCSVYKPRVIASEQTVGDTIIGAGTFDALVVVSVPAGDKCFPKDVHGQDVILLVDWKTSSGIWGEYKAQVAAYWRLLDSKKYDKYFKGFLPSQQFTGVVRVGTKHKSGWEMEVWGSEQTDINFSMFVAARVIADDHEPEYEPSTKTIPVSLSVDVPTYRLKRAKKLPKNKQTK